MNSRERFLKACRCEPVDRPPIWVMRQAGRHLPEYRKLKETYSFHELVQTPELACEVTMQPVRRYDMDAAIIFSDILVIPEALGQPYHFRDRGGIEMEFRIDGAADVDGLDPSGVAEKLGYVGDAIRLVRDEVGDEKAIIGFGGSPWTLATYMVEGGSSKDYTRAKALYYTDRPLFDRLMNTITDAVITYFETLIDAGVDAIQIFDSWGGVLAPTAYEEASVRWMARISEAVRDRVPVIVFSKGAHDKLEAQLKTKPNILGIDWTADLAAVRAALPDDVGVQGNLDPVVLETTPDVVEREARRILDAMGGKPGHIFNLGHGISPHASIENMERLVQTVKSYGA